jgi:hypothetical protein
MSIFFLKLLKYVSESVNLSGNYGKYFSLSYVIDLKQPVKSVKKKH